MKKTKEQKTEKKLSVVRRTSYTFLAFALFELSGVFALAGLKGLYVVTETASNAFYPKKYVDVSINEPNGQDYTITTDGTAKNKDNNVKKASVTNAFGSKKDVILRAKIVAEIYDETNQVYNESLTAADYTISVNGDSTYTDNTGERQWLLHSDGYYYYTSILKVGEETSNLFDNVTITDTGISKIPEDGYVKFHVIIDSLDVEAIENITNYWDWGANAPELTWNSTQTG